MLCLALLLCAVCAAQPRATNPKPPKADLGEGLASYYSKALAGRRTASGERLDLNALTAAHRTLPFGTCVRVVHQENGRSVQVRINDRGPNVKARIIDVTPAAARELDMVEAGLARVRLYRCTPPQKQ